MRVFLISLALAPFLMAATCDERVQSVAIKTCTALNTIYAHYDSLASSGAVPASYMNHVAQVRGLSDKGCANPSTLSTVKLASIAGQSYLALRAAFVAGAGQGAEDYDAEQGLQKLEALRASLKHLRR